ncbi:homoserine kinase [Saccharomonospora sp. CUA-673]|uniref:homoserine kinase n=1 Tax=Saccharomonospora sp. CUA-673 TaxID=1904969 RepID=UPI000964F351|nr:homoserine kinase [Saccharomonospora sp. CUA-673]OLT45184.1 homoserine kinase [Saccharomonospora sp. CUA-673]
MRFAVRVPASTANLGSGFDSLGLALALHDVVEFETTDSGVDIDVVDAGAGDVDAVSRDVDHLVVRAMYAACERLGVPTPGLKLRCHNAIPHSRGLGSSAAAIVTGITAAYTITGRELDADALQLAAEFEGHADNVAASMYGGFVVAWATRPAEQSEAGQSATGERFHAERLTPHASIRPVVLVPPTRSSTHETRGLLPDRVPLADAAFAGSRTALAVHAVTRRPDLLLDATDDRLHQGYRRPAYPDTMRLVDELRARGVAAAVSGAGPTVLALPHGTGAGILPADLDVDGYDVTELAIDPHGVQVTGDPVSA